MKRGIGNGIALGDIDCQNHDLLNMSQITDSPDLVYTDDTRLSDERQSYIGSVTNSNISSQAVIVQSKLDLNGELPTGFLGTTRWTAAQGDLYQPKSDKGQNNGYPSLNGSGKMPTGSVTTSGTGTVVALDVTIPTDEFSITRGLTPHQANFTVAWKAIPDKTWLGNVSGSSAHPSFGSSEFPTSLIPSFSASKITSGMFDLARLPIAVHGGGHAQGLVPDPQPEPVSGTPTDYLARDMTFKTMTDPISYQPTLPDPAITLQSFFGNNAYVTITTNVSHTALFFALDSSDFQEVHSLPLLVPKGSTVRAYAAKAGYNDSAILSYMIPNL